MGDISAYKDTFSNFKLSHIFFFSLLILSWILLIVSFSGTTYWYKYTEEGMVVEWKFNEVRLNIGSDNKYYAVYSEYGENESTIFRACISFSILSFVVVSLILILITLSLIGEKITFIDSNLQIIKKIIYILPSIAFIFNLLSILIAIGFNNAYELDCNKSTSCYQAIFNGGFIGSNDDDSKSWGPSVGWIVSLISACFLFLATSLSVIDFTLSYIERRNNSNRYNMKNISSTPHSNNNGASKCEP